MLGTAGKLTITLLWFRRLGDANRETRIHKEKYQEDAEDDERLGRMSRKSTSDSKKRDKSRTRAFFTRKKSNAS